MLLIEYIGFEKGFAQKRGSLIFRIQNYCKVTDLKKVFENALIN